MNHPASAWVQQGIFGALNFVVAVPVVYLLLGLPLVMREHGWSALDIGLFQLVGLPAVFKVLLAVPVERRRQPVRHYRRWAMGCGVLYVAVLLGFAVVNPDQRQWLVILALATALIATWVDIPINALAIGVLPAQERMRAGSVRASVLFLSAVVGGGVLLVLYAHAGWAAPFYAMAAMMAVSLGTLVLLPVAASEDTPGNQPEASMTLPRLNLRGFVNRPGAWAWLALLALHFPFVAATWVFTKPLLLDLGLSTTQVAWWVGVLGGGVGAVAAFTGSAVIRRYGVRRAIPWLMSLDAVGIGVLAAGLVMQAPIGVLLVGMLLVAAGVGSSSALGFGLSMHYARPAYRALDYGLQASLVTLTRLLVAPLAGYLQSQWGYGGMLIALALAATAVLVLSLRLRDALAVDVEPGMQRS